MSEISLKEYFEQKLHDLDRRYADRFEAQNVAIRKAEDANERRLEGMNEFRHTMDDMTRTFVSIGTYDKLSLDVRDLQRSKSNLDGRMAIISLIVSAVISVAVAALLAYLRH